MGYRFTSNDHHDLTRGTIRFFPTEQFPADLWRPADLVGQTVTIDGVDRVVRGVESHRIAVSPEHPYRLPFGLLTDD